jgi:hydrogenase maturation protease
MRAVVLGIGNTILTDEAAGVRAAEAFERAWRVPANVQVIDGGTSGMEMIEDLSGVDLLVVLDVVRTGAAPGTLVHIAGDEVPVFFRRKLSPHQIGLPDVLASLELLDAVPKEIVVLGVEPLSLELGMEMTPIVASRIQRMADMAACELRSRGYELVPSVIPAAPSVIPAKAGIQGVQANAEALDSRLRGNDSAPRLRGDDGAVVT